MSELHTHEEPQVSVTKSSKHDTLIQSFVDRIERAMIEAKNAGDDLKEIAAECRVAGLTTKKIAAIKQIAKWRMNDKVDEAREGLAELEEVSRAVGMDLFSWSEEYNDR